jgi:hypothetical protein
MTYNTKVILEQGGSVLRVDDTGKIANAGSLNQTGAMFLGDVQFLSATSIGNPTVTAAPGSIFLRVDGSMSNLYVNISDGTAGSVWRGACVVDNFIA